MNKNRFKSDMEAAWELRPLTDTTPETRAHINRFASDINKSIVKDKNKDAENGQSGKKN